MDQSSQERRGLFGGLRVPTDLNMLVLSFIAVVAFWGCVALIESMTQEAHVLKRIAASLGPAGIGAASSLKPITWVLTAAAFLLVWTFFSSAINRIAAMKIAREETLELKEAMRFAGKKFVPVLSSVLVVLTIVVAFYVLCNATIAGHIMWVPGLDIVVSILFFLVLLSTFFIVFSLVLGLFGMNLASSAIAVESSDTWDGISRAWNYVLVRPWHVLLCYGLTIVYLGVFCTFAGMFTRWSVDSLAIGSYGAGTSIQYVEVQKADIAKLPTHLFERAEKKGGTAARFAIPGKVRYFQSYIFGDDHAWDAAPLHLTTEDQDAILARVKAFPEEEKEIVNVRREDDGRLVVLGDRWNMAPLIPTTWKVSAAILWFWITLARFAIAAYAVQYFFAATTMLYFLLRKEVEDEDYGEIVVEEEELEEEAAWEVKEPSKPGVPAPAAGAPPGLKPLPVLGAGSGAPPAPAPAAPPQAPQPPAPGSGPQMVPGAVVPPVGTGYVPPQPPQA